MTSGVVPKMMFTKTETEYNMKSIRFLLLTITCMFIVISGLLIVLGLSVYTHYHSFSYFLNATTFIFTPSILSVILGLVLLVVTLFGFFGTLRLSTCMVNSYACMIFVMLIVKLVVVILAFTIDRTTLINYLNIPMWEYLVDPEVEAEIDNMQNSLGCCGSSSFMDYQAMPFNSNHSVVQFMEVVNGYHITVTVPSSCCITTVDNISCAVIKRIGCKEALVNVVTQNSGVIGVLGVSVMFIELLGIAFAVLLGRCIRKVKSERSFLAWKVKEQQIWTRQQERHRAEVEADDKTNSLYIIQSESSVA